MTWDNLPGKPRERSLTFFATIAFHSSRLATGAQTRMAFTAKADLANKLDRVNDRYSPPTCDDARRARCLEKWARTMLWIGVLIRLSFTFFATNNGGDALARAATTAEWRSEEHTSELQSPM